MYIRVARFEIENENLASLRLPCLDFLARPRKHCKIPNDQIGLVHTQPTSKKSDVFGLPGTFTTIRDSAVLRIVDSDFDWRSKTPRVVRRFNEEKEG